MTLLPFDIETSQLALLAGTGRIVTREGYPVEITCWDNSKIVGNFWPVEGKIHFPLQDTISLDSWTLEGNYNCSSGVEHKYDLFIETDFDL